MRKKIITSVLAIAIIIGSFGLGALAAETSLAALERTYAAEYSQRDSSLSLSEYAVASEVAYLDLESASGALKDEINDARFTLIHSQSWVTEGTAFRIYDDWTVEELPYFYDLFPETWDVPYIDVSESELDLLDTSTITPFASDVVVNGNYAYSKNTGTSDAPVLKSWSFNNGQVLVGATNATTAQINIGLTNMSTGRSIAWNTGTKGEAKVSYTGNDKFTMGVRLSSDTGSGRADLYGMYYH